MDAKIETKNILTALADLDDERLTDLIARAQSILTERQNDRRKMALAQIKRLAKDAGLTVDVKAARKRGRKPVKQAA